MTAGERLDCKVDPFVAFKVMVSIERLWALVTFERSFICVLLLLMKMGLVFWLI